MRVRRAARVLLAAAVLAGGVAGCSDDGPEEGEARLTVDGRAVVTRQGGDEEVVVDQADLRAGDQVALRRGTGTLELADGATLELKEGTGDRADSVLVMGPTPELDEGEVLVQAEDVVTVRADGTDVTVMSGAARVGRTLGMSVGNYTADVRLDSAGVERVLAPLRRFHVATAGSPPAVPLPILTTMDEPDAWDRRFLGDALALSDQLDALAVGFTRSLPAGRPLTASVLGRLIDGLADEEGFDDRLLAGDRAAGDTVVGAAIVRLARDGSFLGRWAAVFTFRAVDAPWGLIALDQGVDGMELLDAVTAAIDEAPLDTATTRPTATTTTRPPATTVPTTPSPDRPSTTLPPITSPPTSAPSPPTTAPPDEPDGALPPLLDPLLSPVTNVLNGLLGGLLGLPLND